MKKEIKMGVKADMRGEIIDVEVEGKRICLVHSLPNSYRAGFYFPDTERKVSIVDGSLTFYFIDPKNPKKQEKSTEDGIPYDKCYKISAGDNLIIPKGMAYLEFNEEEVYFISTCISGSGNKRLIYRPYREIVVDNLK